MRAACTRATYIHARDHAQSGHRSWHICSIITLVISASLQQTHFCSTCTYAAYAPVAAFALVVECSPLMHVAPLWHVHVCVSVCGIFQKQSNYNCCSFLCCACPTDDGRPSPGPGALSMPPPPASGGGPASSSKTGLFDDSSAEIADIDGRLHALQNFLRLAKSSNSAGSAAS